MAGLGGGEWGSGIGVEGFTAVGMDRFGVGCGGVEIEAASGGGGDEGGAPIDDAEVAEGADEDVCGFEVAMDDATGVGVGDDFGDADEEFEGMGPGVVRIGGIAGLAEDVFEGGAGEDVGGVEESAIGIEADVMDGEDAGVLELAGDLGFGEEAGADGTGVRSGGGEPLHGDAPSETQVPGLEDFSLAPVAESFLEFVPGSEFGGGRERESGFGSGVLGWVELGSGNRIGLEGSGEQAAWAYHERVVARERRATGVAVGHGVGAGLGLAPWRDSGSGGAGLLEVGEERLEVAKFVLDEGGIGADGPFHFLSDGGAETMAEVVVHFFDGAFGHAEFQGDFGLGLSAHEEGEVLFAVPEGVRGAQEEGAGVIDVELAFAGFRGGGLGLETLGEDLLEGADFAGAPLQGHGGVMAIGQEVPQRAAEEAAEPTEVASGAVDQSSAFVPFFEYMAVEEVLGEILGIGFVVALTADEAADGVLIGEAEGFEGGAGHGGVIALGGLDDLGPLGGGEDAGRRGGCGVPGHGAGGGGCVEVYRVRRCACNPAGVG